MKLFGFTIERSKSAVGVTSIAPAGWSGIFGPLWPSFVHEPFAGAWQRNIFQTAVEPEIIAQSTVWACITLIAQDISKIAVNVIEQHGDIWEPITNPAYSPVLRDPNHYQHRIKFFEQWTVSKLTRGNTYVLKERNNRGGVGQGNVTALYILDPWRVQVLVAPSGEVFYQLSTDNLSGLEEEVTVPASEIIHDVGFSPYHPLVGLPPLLACALAASQSLSIQKSSFSFFQNNSRPGGVLSTIQRISEETAQRIKAHWEANYSGEQNAGKVAVLGDGLKFEQMAQTAVDSQLADQLKWTDEKICSVFHVPPFMVGVGPMPTYDNIEKLNLQYYQQALQHPIESIEILLDKGLEMPATIGVEFDIEGLIRMDSTSKMKNATEGVRGGVIAPNEARRKLNLPDVSGGDSPYLQSQNFSLEALAKRDAQEDPFGKTPTPTPPAPPESADQDEPEDEEAMRAAYDLTLYAGTKALSDRYAEYITK
jgi:HK97 family phage portal protein